jgi:hypothetical protein
LLEDDAGSNPGIDQFQPATGKIPDVSRREGGTAGPGDGGDTRVGFNIGVMDLTTSEGIAAAQLDEPIPDRRAVLERPAGGLLAIVASSISEAPDSDPRRPVSPLPLTLTFEYEKAGAREMAVALGSIPLALWW